MIKIIYGPGILKMLYNYICNDNKKYTKGLTYQFDKIIEDDNIKNCNCTGKVNKFYIINNSRIPFNRAIKIK